MVNLNDGMTHFNVHKGTAHYTIKVNMTWLGNVDVRIPPRMLDQSFRMLLCN